MLGVNTRAQYFKAPVSDASFIPGGLWLDIQPKNVIQENVKAPIIFEWGCLHGYSYNMRDSRLIFKLKIQKNDGSAIVFLNFKFKYESRISHVITIAM